MTAVLCSKLEQVGGLGVGTGSDGGCIVARAQTQN